VVDQQSAQKDLSNRMLAHEKSGPKGETVPQEWPAWTCIDWWRQVATAKRLVLMLDYDGTLAPFVKDRLRAELYPGVAERLLRLAQCPRLRLIFVSGRQARELEGLLPPGLRAEIWGGHGREHLLLDGSYEVVPLAPVQEQALGWLNRSVRDRGFAELIEEKPGSTALHTRGLSAEHKERLTKTAQQFFAEIESAGFNWLPFDGGIEMRASGCSKASAVEQILRDEGDDVITAYLGDDLTDEEAYRALDGHGLRVLVREELRATSAELWLRPPGELVAFLDGWLDAACRASEDVSS
jgi:trehalose-phosphatase